MGWQYMYMYMQSSSGWVSEWAGSTCTCNMQSSSGWVSGWAGSSKCTSSQKKVLASVTGPLALYEWCTCTMYLCLYTHMYMYSIYMDMYFALLILAGRWSLWCVNELTSSPCVLKLGLAWSWWPGRWRCRATAWLFCNTGHSIEQGIYMYIGLCQGRAHVQACFPSPVYSW